ncbi:LuxR C-terminal-related transcriptional regulator [Citromicrobium bathyomarinum]|uniref:response regulator transcription factor n=1 Tax=Citromicrobium bathyomarinum TaxID=72174 RepID=UPI00315A2E1A
MNHVFVIDSDPERRAEVCRVLLHGERHAEPFETPAEFLAFSKSEGIALVHDRDGAATRLCNDIRESTRLVPVLAYDEEPAIEQVVPVMQAGAASYLAWPFSQGGFSDEIERIGPAMREGLARKRRAAHARSLLTALTAREREVLVTLITLGTNKAIAKELDISPRTVEKYRAAILRRLGVDNSAQAIRVAVEGGAFDQAGAEVETQAALAHADAARGDLIG